LTVSDERAIRASYSMVDTHHVLVETSAGAALSIVFDNHPAMQKYQSVLVIVCGGIGISIELLESMMENCS